MPIYEIIHAVPLSEKQQDELAEAITIIHTTAFGVLRLFVNVRFVDASRVNTYIAGKRRKANHIRATVRLGSRTNEGFLSLCKSVEEVWNRIVYEPAQRENSLVPEQNRYKLQTLIVSPVNLIGFEAGFELPLGGEDGNWLTKHWNEFRQKASEGDEDFIQVVKEVEERGLLK
ncbi:hypothetical protein BGW36DRAFT_354528 [Talaromyces proteolyticus]|uniref:Tautomerase cis-CaaD-like domain-containing protein n=1 Tax=Talaromyces proteolyticus TaxID=1131652 RepID=A0AAD4L076_9EURO|nr:uncharacterized protein BGW36DRAFT_354528 [Talaromyces proteolyticus]KAH8703095.1 hypothetical protein BGW36DRAFT_354528 [Talaromyces proteolyticus]